MKRALVILVLCAWAAPLAAATVDYARDVLPILSDKCYHCHGPDEVGRKGKLRLDTREGAFRTKDAVIIPGKSAESELIRRLVAKDPDDLMPPPDSNRSLTAQQVETLRRWVDEGANWGTHWAFVAPQKKEVLRGQASRAKENPIDGFIQKRLEKEKLSPAPAASRETWLRRVTFDLTGLPPTLAELDAFLADTSTNAHEKVVDRLLASPRFGERMATEWLDVARFADTHGYQMDRFRPVWPYRDWVIQAFNRNMPFDQFVTWQLAGDLLPNATKEQRLATAFNRLHNQNEEGGIVEEEYRVAYVVDRVNTFSTAFLGLTSECARCHDHKYDPFTQKDFYSLFAFFQNIDESGQTSYFTDSTPVPTLLLSAEDQDKKLTDLQARIKAKEDEITVAKTSAREAFAQWRPPQDGLAIPGLIGHYNFDRIVSNRLANLVSTNFATARENPRLVPGKFGQATELNGENGFSFGQVGHFNRANPFSVSLWLKTPTNAARFVVLHKSMAPIDAGSRGYELLLEHGRVAFGLHHMWPGNSLKVSSKAAISTNEWTHVAVTYDGSSRASGTRIYINGALAELEVIRDGLWKDIIYGNNEAELMLGHRMRDNGFKGGLVDELQIYKRALSRLEVLVLAGQPVPMHDAETFFEYFFATQHAPAQTLEKELYAIRNEQRQFINPIPEIMVMQELPTPKPAFVLKRGSYDSPGQSVTADTPHVLPPFPANAPRNRLGLAQWLLQPDHPLMGRVTVNRLWQLMFGRGLVETSDNFGTQGAHPTHPELLDWLARDFAETGWDTKQFLKRIALSDAYRRSSIASSSAKDPSNELLARGPSRRLTAEMLRDQALAVSGLLVDKVGGPSVKPYQPEGLWEIAMDKKKYDQGRGADLYRRSLYTYWKRTVPPPMMITFDAADRSYCTVKRQSTSTPLQALTLLNDIQFTEAARKLAERMMKEGGTSLDTRLTWIFRSTAHRSPSAKELPVLRKLYEEQEALFKNDAEAAARLLKVGSSNSDAALPAVELAAATVLAQALLNHDAAVMLR